MSCKTIVIANQKGGVGKSTIAGTIAAGLAKKGKRVLAIDMDAQANLTHTSKAGEPEITTFDVLAKEATINQAIIKRESYDLVPADNSLTGSDSKITEVGKEYRLRDALKSIKSKYDFIIIDTPPALGVLTINALTAADTLIIPAQADMYSLLGISQLWQTIEPVREYCNPKLKISGIVLVRYNARTSLSREVLKAATDIATGLKTKVYESKIREATVVKEAQMWQTDIFEYAPSANVTKDFEALIDEIMEEK